MINNKQFPQSWLKQTLGLQIKHNYGKTTYFGTLILKFRMVESANALYIKIEADFFLHETLNLFSTLRFEPWIYHFSAGMFWQKVSADTLQQTTFLLQKNKKIWN